MAAIAGHRLTLDPIGKCSNAFFSETTNMIKAKLYMNVHWMVLYNLKVFCSDMKFKMAATAGLSLTLDPMHRCQPLRFFRNCYEFRAKITVLRSTVYLLRISDYCRPETVPI